MSFSNLKTINLENIKAVEKRAGVYEIANKKGQLIYVGVSKNLRHRLHALRYGRADYKQIPAKANLRKRAKYFRVKYCGIKKARLIEKDVKERLGI